MKATLRSLILLAFIISLHKVQAQKDFERGYIIRTTSHDTIWGLIENKNWDTNPTSVVFKTDSGPRQLMRFADIDEFSVASAKTKEVYRKKILDIDKGKFQLNELKNYPDVLISRDTVFATLYESGKVNLYYLRDENARYHYLIEKNDTGIRDLRLERYIDAGTQTVRSNDLFKNQLNALMSDCSGIILKISELTFTESELRKLVVYYNNCVDGEKKHVKYSQAKESVDFFVGALLGAGFRTDKISNVPAYLLSGYKFGPSPNLDAAMILGFVIPRSNRHLELGIELGWGYFNEQKTLSGLSVILAAHEMKGNLLLRYLTSAKKNRFSLTAGFSLAGILSAVNKYGEPGSWSPDAIPMGSFQAAMIIGAGARVKDFNIEMRYFLNSSLANGLYIKTFSNSLNLTLYYNFYNNTKARKRKTK